MIKNRKENIKESISILLKGIYAGIIYYVLQTK